MKTEHAEGWTFLHNSTKRHWFRRGVSLCNRWMYPGSDLETDLEINNSKNCTDCRRKRLSEIAKEGK